MSDFDTHMRNDARLVILQALSIQRDSRLSEKMLHIVLDTEGHNRTRNWLRTQLRELKDLGAIKLHDDGSAFVAEIIRAGQDHVERRSVIEGVACPDVEE